MQDSNSLRSVLPRLIKSILVDVSSDFPSLTKAFSLDLKKFTKRLENEGLPYVTVLLPSLYKSLLRGIESGRFDLPLGFKRGYQSKLPTFLGGLFRTVFTAEGVLLDNPNQEAIKHLGSICQVLYKIDIPCSSELNQKVIDNFLEVEKELECLELDAYDPILEGATSVLKEILNGFNPMNILPRHGSGAVATGERYQEKWVFKRKYQNIHKVYPYYEYFVPSRKALLDKIDHYKSLEKLEYGTAKVALVPKDSRGPRLISLEPLEFQYIQQGLSRALTDHIQMRSPSKGLINFSDQTVNRTLALTNSMSGEYATLDMKEASDRVSLKLVKRLFAGTGFLKHLLATRSAKTRLPDGRVVHLNKYAPMGSALCFPIEALCFYSLAESVRRQWHIPGNVYVYGDDIIVPKRLVSFLFELFPSYGLKFNEDKCFVKGPFRESCGMNAFKGADVTPIRIKTRWPSTRRDAFRLVAAVDMINRYYVSGYYVTSTYLKELFVEYYKLALASCPVQSTFSGLAWLSRQGYQGKTRWNAGTQKTEYKSYGFRQKTVRCVGGSWGRLHAALCSQTLLNVPVPHAGSLKMRWCS